MDRATAARLVCKLDEMTVARGATGPEAREAAKKAAGLRARFGLGARETRPRVAAGPQRVWRAAKPNEWEFDVRTGRASTNVKVHRYNSPVDWHIEIPL